MDEEQKKEYWAKIRSTSIVSLILKTGIVRVTLPATILTQIIVYLIEHGFTSSFIPDRFTSSRIISYIFGIAIGGVVFAALMRIMAERNYRMSPR